MPNTGDNNPYDSSSVTQIEKRLEAFALAIDQAVQIANSTVSRQELNSAVNSAVATTVTTTVTNTLTNYYTKSQVDAKIAAVGSGGTGGSGGISSADVDAKIATAITNLATKTYIDNSVSAASAANAVALTNAVSGLATTTYVDNKVATSSSSQKVTLIGNLSDIYANASTNYLKLINLVPGYYISNTNLNLKKIDTDWAYKTNPNNIFNAFTKKDIRQLTAELNQSDTIYVQPIDSIINNTVLTQPRVIYTDKIISTAITSYELEYLKPTTGTFVDFVLGTSHDPYAYFEYVANKYLLIGPNIQLEKNSISESKANDVLFSIINNTTNTFAYTITTSKSELKIVQTNGTYNIVAAMDINYADYATDNYNIKINLLANDGVYNYGRTYFIKIIPTTAAGIIAALNIGNQSVTDAINLIFSKISSGSKATLSDFNTITAKIASELNQTSSYGQSVYGIASSISEGLVSSDPASLATLTSVSTKLQNISTMANSVTSISDIKKITQEMSDAANIASTLSSTIISGTVSIETKNFATALESTITDVENFISSQTNSVSDNTSSFIALVTELSDLVNGKVGNFRDRVVRVLDNSFNAYGPNLITYVYKNNDYEYYDGKPNEALNWFIGKDTHLTTYLSAINFWYGDFFPLNLDKFNPQNVAISTNGFFCPDETGIWRFLAGTYPHDEVRSNYSNDDISHFWFNTKINERTLLNTKLTTSYVSYKINGGSDANPNLTAYTYEVSLEKGKYYPMSLNWAQTGGGAVFCLHFAKPSAPNKFISNGTNYYFHLKNSPTIKPF